MIEYGIFFKEGQHLSHRAITTFAVPLPQRLSPGKLSKSAILFFIIRWYAYSIRLLAPETYRRDLKYIQDEDHADKLNSCGKICTAISAGNLYLTLYNVNSATKPTQKEESLL